MDAIDVIFRLIGAFYVFAGWLALRAILMDSLLDKVLTAVSAGKEDPSETWRRWILGALTVLIGASGAALLTMSNWALPLFVFCAASQAVWIGGARRFFIAPDDDDATGRGQVRNAAILYGAVALGVVWLWSAGRLLPWGEPFGIAGTALTGLGLGVWFVYHMAWRAASPAAFDPADDGQDMPAPARVVISPRQGFYPLVDADTGQRFSHMYWYDGTLGWRIEDWDDVFQEAFTLEDVLQGPDFASPEAEAAWRAEGLAIAGALKEILGPENVGFAGGWETGQGADA